MSQSVALLARAPPFYPERRAFRQSAVLCIYMPQYTTHIWRRRRLSRHLPWPMYLTRPVSQTLKSRKRQIHQNLYSVRLRAMRVNRSRGPGRTGPLTGLGGLRARDTDLRVTLGRGETSAVLSSVSRSDVRYIRAARS